MTTNPNAGNSISQKDPSADESQPAQTCLPWYLAGLHYWFPFLLGLLIITAMGFYIRRSVDPPLGRWLHPGPDATEYAEMARRFAYLEGFGLHVSGADIPSRYPALFPLVLSPVARIVGGDAIRYSTAMALLGSLSIVLAGLFGTLISGYRRAGLLLAALLAVSGSHIHASHMVMSDVLMLLLYQASAILALVHRRCWFNPSFASYLSILVAGVLAGSLVAVRTPGTVLAAGFGLFYFLLLISLLTRKTDRLANFFRPLAVAALLLLGACFPLAFELISRKMQFGSALADPYGYYIPSFRAGSDFEPLSLDWITTTNNNTRKPNLEYFGKMVLGTDEYHQAMRLPLGSALVSAGLILFLAMAVRRRDGYTLLIIIAGPAALLLLHMMYYWQEARLILVPVLISLFLVANLLAVLSVMLTKLFVRYRASTAARIVGISVFSLAGAGLLYLQKEPVDNALHVKIDLNGIGGELRQQLHEKINELPRTQLPPVVVTNAGNLRVQNLLFPGPSSSSSQVITLTNAFDHDEHVFRVTQQEPYGIPEGFEIEMPKTVMNWQNPERSGSGPLELQVEVLNKLRTHTEKSHVVIFLKVPDPAAESAIETWKMDAGWSIHELAQFHNFQLLEATPPTPANQ